MAARTVAFVFSDLEGSTELLESLGAASYGDVLALYREVVEEATRQEGGEVIDREGDGLFLVFPTGSAALRAVAHAQAELRAQHWPQAAEVRTRMGIHAGEAEVGELGYVGLDVHRAARVAQAAWGGQVLVSEAAADLARQNLDDRLRLEDLGLHRLKGLSDPTRLYQLAAPGLDERFPPPRTLEHHPHNLPQPLTSFVGREGELARTANLLESTRLLTLTGPGGIGKTRLAREAAARQIERRRDGAWWVELASLSDPALVPHQVAQTLGVREGPGRSMAATLFDYLRDKDLLLCLDNCEHLVEEVALFTVELLGASSDVRVIATSREPLGLQGETVLGIDPLPMTLTDPTIGDEAQIPSVELFCDRARQAHPGFQLTEENASAVLNICRRVEGLPLALELAAAWIRTFSAPELLTRLTQGLALSARQRDLPERHRTLEATIEWSHRLLEPSQRQLLGRLAVFQGGFSLEAAEQVASEDGDDLLITIQDLVDRSFLRPGTDGHVARFRMLEMIRRFAWDILPEEERSNLRQGHAAYFQALAEQGDERLAHGDQPTWLARLEAEHDNLRAALSWLEETDAYGALRLAAALGRFWLLRGHLFEGRRCLEGALQQTSSDVSEIRARALHQASSLAFAQGEYQEAALLRRQALEIYREFGDLAGVASALGFLGTLQHLVGNVSSGEALQEEALELFRALEDRSGLASTISVWRAAGAASRTQQTEDLVAETLGLFQESGNTWGAATSYSYLGEMARGRGDLKQARTYLVEAFERFGRLGDQRGIAQCLESLGGMASRRGDHLQAIALLGLASRLRIEIGAPLPPSSAHEFDQWVDAARGELGADQFTSAWREAQDRPLEDVWDRLARPEPSHSTSQAPSPKAHRSV